MDKSVESYTATAKRIIEVWRDAYDMALNRGCHRTEAWAYADRCVHEACRLPAHQEAEAEAEAEAEKHNIPVADASGPNGDQVQQ